MAINDYQPYNCETTVTIAASGTTSTVADLLGTRCVGVIMPAAMTGTALTIQASLDNDTYYDIYNTEGTQLSIISAASRWIALVPADLAGVRYIKFISNATEAAEREIRLVTRPLS